MTDWLFNLTKLFTSPATSPGGGKAFRIGEAIELARDLVGVQSPDGSLTPREQLGPGIVEQLDEDGRVQVRWVLAGFSVWLDPYDLRSPADNSHLITIRSCDESGSPTLLRYKVAPIEHNWTVELRPRYVIRTVREDGAAWTFHMNSCFRSIIPPWPAPPDDDTAEALTAADISIARKKAGQS